MIQLLEINYRMFGMITYNLDLLILDLHFDLLNPLWFDVSMLILNPLFYRLILQFILHAKSPFLITNSIHYFCIPSFNISSAFLQHFKNNSTTFHCGVWSSLNICGGLGLNMNLWLRFILLITTYLYCYLIFFHFLIGCMLTT